MRTKETIIQEFKEGGISLTGLEAKHGISRRTITRWLLNDSDFAKNDTESSKIVSLPPMKNKPEQPLPTDVIQLQKELEKERLQNKLLNAMIDIAEKELKIPIRKKSGTKQSSK